MSSHSLVNRYGRNRQWFSRLLKVFMHTELPASRRAFAIPFDSRFPPKPEVVQPGVAGVWDSGKMLNIRVPRADANRTFRLGHHSAGAFEWAKINVAVIARGLVPDEFQCIARSSMLCLEMSFRTLSSCDYGHSLSLRFANLKLISRAARNSLVYHVIRAVSGQAVTYLLYHCFSRSHPPILICDEK